MSERDHQRDVRIVPHGMRDEFRSEQIQVIRTAIQDTYRALLRAATSGAAKREIEAQRDAEIDAATEQLLHERQSDTPDCL